MLVLGIESSCDETGLALYDSERGLLSHALHSQVEVHAPYGGVVPELASRDHIRRLSPLLRQVLQVAQCSPTTIDLVAYTRGPGLAGALLTGAAFAESFACALGKPAIGIHHLEGHLLSPLFSDPPPAFPFVALLVSGGHSQLLDVQGVGNYRLLGETLDDAAGEAFDKSAMLLGLPYPGGAALSQLADKGNSGHFNLPRPLLSSGTLDFSFSGLKTAVRTRVAQAQQEDRFDDDFRSDLALAFQEAMCEVLCAKTLTALQNSGRQRLVVAGGVGANHQLRNSLKVTLRESDVHIYYPPLEFCTDNGAMIALAGAMRWEETTCKQTDCRGARQKIDLSGGFSVLPRWPLHELSPPGASYI